MRARTRHWAAARVVDTGDNSFRVPDNAQNPNSPHAAGIQAARTVPEAGDDAVVTGYAGPKAFSALETAAITDFRTATAWRAAPVTAGAK